MRSEIADGDAGIYQATGVDYYVEASGSSYGAADHHSQQIFKTTIVREPSGASSYHMERTCKAGYWDTTFKGAMLIPDTIRRSQGTIEAKSEEFTSSPNGLTLHNTEALSSPWDLDTYFAFTRSGGLVPQAPAFRIYWTSSSTFDLLVKVAADDYLNKVTMHVRIHYVFAPAPVGPLPANPEPTPQDTPTPVDPTPPSADPVPAVSPSPRPITSPVTGVLISAALK